MGSAISDTAEFPPTSHSHIHQYHALLPGSSVPTAAWQQCANNMAATNDAESLGDKWGEKAGSLLYSALATCQDDDYDRESAKDQVSGAVPILSLRQRVRLV